jgi:hypothetical protein
VEGLSISDDTNGGREGLRRNENIDLYSSYWKKQPNHVNREKKVMDWRNDGSTRAAREIWRGLQETILAHESFSHRSNSSGLRF